MSRRFTAITAVLLTFALLFGFAGCSFIPEEEEETTTEINIKTPLPTDVTSSVDEDGNVVTGTEYTPQELSANSAKIFMYFTEHMNALKSKQAAVRKSHSLNISKCEDEDGNSIPYCENEYLAAGLTALRKRMAPDSHGEIEYGSRFYSYIPVKNEKYVTALTINDVESATCVDDGAVRTITVNLKQPVERSTVEKAYNTEDVKYIMKQFGSINKYFEIGEPEITFKACSIIITVNAETDEITQIRYEKSSDVAVTATGTGTLESVGEQNVRFSFSTTETFDFDYTDPNAPTEETQQ